MTVYHTSSQAQAQARRASRVPRRAAVVLRHLRHRLTPGNAKAISNKQIQAAIGFGSEGEVSQIMRWLSGELPTAGRWAHQSLAAPQTHRYITREIAPSGGYLITLLASPHPIESETLQ